MSSNIPNRPELKALNLPKDPNDWPRVRVTDQRGKQRWRKIEDIIASDTIDTKKGVPITMKGRPGRPKKQEVAPVTPLVNELVKMKNEAIQKDPVMKLAEDNPDSPDVLHAVISALAEETAALRFERHEAERQGETSAGLSERRVRALKTLGDTWLKRKELLSASYIDLESPGFMALLELIVETMIDAMEYFEMSSEMVDSIIQQFSKLLSDEGWKQEAKSRMRDSE